MGACPRDTVSCTFRTCRTHSIPHTSTNTRTVPTHPGARRPEPPGVARRVGSELNRRAETQHPRHRHRPPHVPQPPEPCAVQRRWRHERARARLRRRHTPDRFQDTGGCLKLSAHRLSMSRASARGHSLVQHCPHVPLIATSCLGVLELAFADASRSLGARWWRATRSRALRYAQPSV